MARPTKFNDDRAERISSALRAGNTRKASAAYAGISQDTFATWLHRYPSFAESVEKAEADAEVRHVANIAKAAGEGIWTASAWWLERRRHQEWGRKDRVDIIATVRLIAEQHGLTEAETAEAVAEAERYLKEIAGARAR